MRPGSRAGRRGSARSWACSPTAAAPVPAVLSERLPGWREPARALLARGWLASAESLPDAPSGTAQVRPGAPQLSEEQALAVETIGGALGAFGTFVLHGITGSGKTEVYLRLHRAGTGRGAAARWCWCPRSHSRRSCVARFRERFDTPMAVLHSGLTDHERLARLARRLQWRGAPGARHALGGVRAGA